MDKDFLLQYLQELKKDLAKLQAAVAGTTDAETTFVRGIPMRPGDVAP